MPASDVDPAFLEMLEGYGLTSAEILYRMPDHPALLQSFSWQFHDIAPDYPRLKRFLAHWEREVEAAIHSVRFSHARLVGRREIRTLTELGRLH
ncbi:usg protein [Mangrovibrevibacter kandeliae]|uniref:usg protein n=1 Tax=Mangrovibrevibacter kandeliae TaxID=2968473 RepID=UPI002117AEAA|nr:MULTISPECIES: usg protein [unclassified Aurantimonas]MCQ8782737.1 usg protein [Aurantimonas sp. CSK15Z-1]MCW4114455.1 usg protein [Aurantimonas sp. MSK8Z-1]